MYAIRTFTTFHTYLITVISVACILYIFISRLIPPHSNEINKPCPPFSLVKLCFSTIVVLLMWRYFSDEQLKMCITVFSYIFLGLEIQREYQLYSFSVKHNYFIRDQIMDYSSLVLLSIFIWLQWVDWEEEEEKLDDSKKEGYIELGMSVENGRVV